MRFAMRWARRACPPIGIYETTGESEKCQALSALTNVPMLLRLRPQARCCTEDADAENSNA